ncbi:phage portal protein [Escherichia coli]|uniref:phage portal protein n=1 Tax=Escherichia coli TaxID=562 RepID=UPI0024AE286A|nr:phage portal protein [Escherichia coli]WHG78077.1 phage portal protein [Escherichia coli]
MFNLFRRKKVVETPVKTNHRQQQKLFINKSVEKYQNDLNKRSLGLVGDRIDGQLQQDTITGTFNKALKSNGKRLYDQGRTLALNTSVGSRYTQYIADMVVGTGLDPKPSIVKSNGKLDSALNKQIENAFWKWAQNAKRFSRNGRFNFRELLVMAERERVMGGECFIVLTKENNELNVSILSADKCDWTLNREVSKERAIYQGVEYDVNTMRPVAYWFRKINLLTQTYTGDNYRVDASQVCHYYQPLAAESLRGVTDFLPVIKDIAHQDAFRETAIVQKRIAASSMGFIERPKDSGDDFDTGEDDEQYQAPEVVQDFAPGTIQELPEGATIKSIQATQSGDDFNSFNDAMFTSVSMGLGVFKQGLTGDCSQINYSAARFGELLQRNRVKSLQNKLIETVVLPIFEAYLRHYSARGIVPIRITAIPHIIDNTTIIRPRFESVDVIKDVNADIALIDKGLKSRTAVILERGDDPEKVFSEIQAEKSALNIIVNGEGEEKNPPADP